jgi:rhamnogalacturonan endolyase
MKEFYILSTFKRIIFGLCILGLSFQDSYAQYQMENLTRGIVAVSTGGSNVFVSWRWLGTENDITFNLYRNGTKINSTPLTVCNYTDNAGSTSATYYVKAIVNGVEQSASESTAPWADKYMKLPLSIPAGGTTPDGVAYTYNANDCSIGDVDGDGVHEIFVKWDPTNSKDNSQSGYTGNVYIDCYTIKGVRLWRIDLGRNIRAGAHYTQFLVYDFDGDGKAEMACKTADATKDGKGVVIGNGSADYRNSKGYVLSGPEFLTVFNGQTGAAMSTVNYTPARGTVSSWGDSYGNRVDRFISAVVYLDGVHPSMVFGRGYYTRLVRSAWDFKNGQLVQRWIFDSNNSGSGGYKGQGNHQMTIGDVDQDGKQEICNGASVINENGAGLYVTGHGHGDALHMSDMDPDRAGLEVWQCNEEPGVYGNYALELKDAKTGQTIFSPYSGNQGDVGRCMAADIDPRYKGYEMWAQMSVYATFSCKGQKVASSRPSTNFAVYWDGDLQRELLDGSGIDKWDYLNSRSTRLLTMSDAAWGNGVSCNTTKATPNLSCDLFGDWREEVILHSSDNKFLLFYTTTIPSTYKFRTLLHDPQYRTAIAWQQSCYNQPPHLGYYLGSDMATPSKPNIVLIGAPIIVVPPPVAKKYIYNYDNSGNLAWSNTNSWTPKAVPTAIDTVIIRTGEVQIGNLNHTAPVYVETNGTLRLIDTSTIAKLYLQGGTLKAYTSAPGMMLTSTITVQQPSTIMAGSVPATIFTLNGTITGNANLTKTSVGNLRINAVATGFKGNWIITEGKLQLRSASGLGVCGVQVKSGARLDIETAGASIYSLVVETGGGVDLDQPLATNVAVFGTTNILTGAYQNAAYPTFIGSTNTLNVSNSLVSLSGPTAFCQGNSLTLTASSGASYIWKNNATQVATTATYTTAAVGSYTVDATNSIGCKVTSAPIATTIATAPTASITTSSNNICNSASVVLTASAGSSCCNLCCIVFPDITCTGACC